MSKEAALRDWHDGYVDGIAGIQPLLRTESYLQGWATGRHKDLHEVESELTLLLAL